MHNAYGFFGASSGYQAEVYSKEKLQYAGLEEAYCLFLKKIFLALITRRQASPKYKITASKYHWKAVFTHAK